ncbi:outer membrane protein assembly factor BamD [Prolixibacteraceae bacterium JC049]|nr:outer membrane protein assembly factor BamD [Prolixibacteraceae bacterium JC049]
MFQMKNYKILISGLLLLLVAACGDYNKVLQSTDTEYKYKKAVDYYKTKEYAKAIGLFTDLVRIYRGTSKADDIYYYFAKSHMGQRDYLMAGHFFKNLVKEYPRSDYAEESQYMIGYCFYLDSPKPRLDQTTSQQAIDALQFFINIYPSSSRVEEARRIIDELKDKLVYKSYLSGKLYFDLGQYKAAVISLNNSLKEYPQTKYREELSFMLLEAKYRLGINSVEEKRVERLNMALDEYFAFADEFPKSKYIKTANKYYKTLAKTLNYKEEVEEKNN